MKNANGAAPIERSSSVDGKKPLVPDEAVAVAEREPEADGPVDDRADAEDEHVLAGDVRRVLHPRQPRLEEGEPGLHEHHEHGRDHDPDGVDGEDEVAVFMRLPSPRAAVRFGCG